MGKSINFNYNNKEYTLEFTRKSIQKLEGRGFVASDLQTKPMTVLPQLFAGSFIAHQPFAKADDIENIYASFKDKDKLLDKLAEMYSEPIEALFEEPDEKNAIAWETNF